MVLPDRIELSASPLPRGCSTTELRQQVPQERPAPGPVEVGAVSAIGSCSTQAQKTPREQGCNSFQCVNISMSKSDQAKAREHRLAAKLRENLKRRKGQEKRPAPAAPLEPPPPGGAPPTPDDKP